MMVGAGAGDDNDAGGNWLEQSVCLSTAAAAVGVVVQEEKGTTTGTRPGQSPAAKTTAGPF